MRPAVNVFASLGFDSNSIRTPELPAGTEPNDPEPVFLGVMLTSGAWPLAFGLLLSIIPKLGWFLASLWALMKIWRNDRKSIAIRVVWTVVVVAVPLLGAMVFLAFGDATNRRLRRAGTVLGGLFGWMALVGGAFWIAGLL